MRREREREREKESFNRPVPHAIQILFTTKYFKILSTFYFYWSTNLDLYFLLELKLFLHMKHIFLVLLPSPFITQLKKCLFYPLSSAPYLFRELRFVFLPPSPNKADAAKTIPPPTHPPPQNLAGRWVNQPPAVTLNSEASDGDSHVCQCVFSENTLFKRSAQSGH